MWAAPTLDTRARRHDGPRHVDRSGEGAGASVAAMSTRGAGSAGSGVPCISGCRVYKLDAAYPCARGLVVVAGT
jgi:hypothetical protein